MLYVKLVTDYEIAEIHCVTVSSYVTCNTDLKRVIM